MGADSIDSGGKDSHAVHMVSPESVKKTLLALREPELDFTVIFSGKKSRKVHGLYKSDFREILIHNRNFLADGSGLNENLLVYTAIHEYAHHLHSCRRGGSLPPRAHGPEFWSIFHSLLDSAEQQGVYRTGLDDAPALQKITERIKEKYLAQNGLMFKEFGSLLAQAGQLCRDIGLRFEDYLDRVLCIPKNAAKLAIKAFEYDINPVIGVDNMRYVAALRPGDARLSAEKSLLLGKSPDSVKQSLREAARPAEEDARAALEKEKQRLERTIAALRKRLDEVDQKLTSAQDA